MDTLSFFELLANNVHHHLPIDHLVRTQPIAIRDAFIKNEAEQIKRQLCAESLLANTSHVMQV